MNVKSGLLCLLLILACTLLSDVLSSRQPDFKAQLPRVPPKTPQESLALLHVIPGFRLDQVATEPLVASPVDLDFDADGRLYVAEMIGYSERDKEFVGRVAVLEDVDAEGHFHKSSVLVDKLSWNAAVMCYDGGAFVGAAPDLLYCKDTHGTGKADVREVVITGFAQENINAFVNSFRWGLDNRIHGVTSTAGGQLRAIRWERGASGRKAEPLRARGRDFSFDPRTGELRLESGGAQHGMTFDPWGRKFVTSNSNHIMMVMYEDRYVARNPYLAPPSPRVDIATDGPAGTVYRTSPLEAWRVLRTQLRVAGAVKGPVEGGGTAGGYFTSACGIMNYTGDAWPAEFRGNSFTCEGANNAIHRDRLESQGVGLLAYRADERREFITSDEVWFRGVQLNNAPDGCLYVADMYREILEHPQSIPPMIKKHLDLNSGAELGRIYRVAPVGFRQPRPVRLSKLPTVELVALLAHANGWHRTTASRLLYERQDRAAIAPLERLAAQSPSPLGRMHALYALDGLGALTAAIVAPRLADPHPRVREHAVRLAERVLGGSAAVRERLCAMAGDDDMRVRYQLAFTLGEMPGLEATAALARVAARDADDKWIRLAVLSSCLGRAGDLFARLAADRAWRARGDAGVLLEQLAEQAGLQGHAAQTAAVLKALDGLDAQEKSLARAVVRGLTRGLARSGSALRGKFSEGKSHRAAEVLGEMLNAAAAAAVDQKKSLAVRAEAIRVLALAPLGEVRAPLAELLSSQQPKEIQLAALESLGRFAEPEVARTIVDAWPGFSPQVRNEAAEIVFSRPSGIAVLLDAVQRKSISTGQIEPARIAFLNSHPDPRIRGRAGTLFAKEKLGRRPDVIAAYRSVLQLQGVVARGKEVFKKNCATCHRLEGVGFDLGLPLTTVGSKGPEYLLVNILDPNLQVLPEYINYVVTTKDGRTFTGMIAAETATSLTLRRAEGQSDTVLRANVDELQSTGLSLMPEGLEKQVSKQEMADLIAYLMSIK
jgi:putative membrane-bound dehydrogenase-like protein